MGRVLAIVNQKGGVGKTTTVVNLGAALADCDRKVLIVDMDAQGNATTALGISRHELDACIYTVLAGQIRDPDTAPPIADVTYPTPIPGLFAVPARMELAAADIELVAAMAREICLRRAIAPIVGDYDYVILDSPPSLSLLTINCLTAAQAILIPMQCEYYALEGLSQLLRVVGMVQNSLSPALRLAGVVLTMFDQRTALSHDVANEVRRHLPDSTYRTVIPRSVRVSEAPSHGLPVTHYAPTSAGARAYRLLAREVIQREEAGSGTGA